MGFSAAFPGVHQLIITGGSGGLGQAILRAFRPPAWRGDAPTHRALDVTDAEAVESYLTERPVDLLICGAGIIHDAPLLRHSENAWDEVIATNFDAAAHCASAVLPQMRRQGHGHIVFISSYSALHPPLGQVAYATAKAGLLGLTAGLARKHGSHGIRVNAVLPGFLDTPMTAGVSDKRKASVLEDHALGRLNTPRAVASFIRCLHEDLTHTSGQTFQLDSRSA